VAKDNKSSKKQQYIPRSPAVCVTVHNPSGRPLPDEIADEITQAVWDTVSEHGLLINIART
jgi:hypothetical protein